MIKNFDKIYEKMANKTPTSTILRDEIITFTVKDDLKESSTEIIQEMLINESDYARQLTIGIQTYLTYDVTITETIREKIAKIFGNIQQIRDFHENTFYLNLTECKNDVTKIANIFIKYTQVLSEK